MKAVFITTETVDCLNHVKAWGSIAGKSTHVTFNHHGIKNDWRMIDAVVVAEPDVVFYIGPCSGRGCPKIETLQYIRQLVPFINICSDAEDIPWHGPLRRYTKEKCFTLQVSIDGALNAPVDLVTLTPVDMTKFTNVTKDILCGFSGSVGRWNTRSEVVNALEWLGGLTVRKRNDNVSYHDHTEFVSRCNMLLNLSWTGSGNAHHMKGRVVEAGFAHCALLEHENSPIAKWFPEGAWLTWRDVKDIKRMIDNPDEALLQKAAGLLSATVQEKYRPEHIYGSMLRAAGVDHTF